MELKIFFADFELIGAIFCLIATAYLVLGKSVIKKQYRALAYLEAVVAVMLFFDAFAWYYRGIQGQLAYWVVFVSNMISYIAVALLQVFYVHYVIVSMREKEKDYRILFVISGFSWTNIALIVISQFTGFIYSIDPATNLYQRGNGFPLISAIAFINSIVALSYLLSKRNQLSLYRLMALLSFVLLPTLAGVFQLFIYGYSLSNLTCFACALFIFFQAIYDNTNILVGQQKHISKQDSELQDMRTRIALSQIRPEFLYDALNSVYNLCDKDPALAKELIVHLENYLRENIQSIDMEGLVPFGRELEHTRVFLAIERFKYRDRFDAEFDIDTTDFELPALTVQPIVENAIRHGISVLPANHKGLIRISTERGNGYVKVQVTDNGIGFDMNEYYREDTDGSSQIGIKNVRDRLKVMEDAELHVISKPGEGTVVDMIIPTKR